MANPREMLKGCAGMRGDRREMEKNQREEVKQPDCAAQVRNAKTSIEEAAQVRTVSRMQPGHSIYTGLMQRHDRMRTRYLG